MNLNEELIDAYLFQNVEMEYVLNRQTGEIFLDASESITGEPGIDWDDEETAENLIYIPQISSSDAFEVMVMFIKEQPPVVREQLINTLNGRKPFRNFKDQVHRMGIQDGWYKYENEYAKKWLFQWLEENDIELDLVSEG